jgi:hypothetical protein
MTTPIDDLAGITGRCWFCRREVPAASLIAGYDTFEEQRLACNVCDDAIRWMNDHGFVFARSVETHPNTHECPWCKTVHRFDRDETTLADAARSTPVPASNVSERLRAVHCRGCGDESVECEGVSLVEQADGFALAHAAPEGLDVIEDAITLLEAAPAYLWTAGEPDETIAALRALAARLSQPDATEEAVSFPTIEQKYRLREVLLTHTFILVFRDEVGDLGRCSCGEQGFDFKDGREWYANHVLALLRGELDVVQNRST